MLVFVAIRPVDFYLGRGSNGLRHSVLPGDVVIYTGWKPYPGIYDEFEYPPVRSWLLQNGKTGYLPIGEGPRGLLKRGILREF